MDKIFVVGKGGVGKTTVTAALALKEERRTFAMSLDPLPNLCEVIGIRCSFEPVEYKGKYFAEIDYDKVRKLWIERFGEDLKEILDDLGIRGKEAEEVMEHVSTAPGVPEQFAMLFALEKAQELGAEVLYFDTPPLGPVLHMLKTEKIFYDHMTSATKVYGKIIVKLGLRGSKILKVIEKWREIADYVLKEIKDSKYVLVSTPERFPLKIALRGAEELEEFGIRHSMSFLNKSTGERICLKSPTYAIPFFKKDVYDEKQLFKLIDSIIRIC
ncbi:hypothetical protein IPA_03435 [Ignicoccus pacificus DSM 13166]|uniref:ArsA/GET3 Anion-transporting ATPase-like domain-containing protein n=1 Tax=Ignicoccus pacificus DSM 13166 TaxID=940294 RepID=A0A977KAX4_9CREN|nr:hypothetical protein IPA_03435 [Ignicoccus pacificus DSM 13166]